MDTVVFFILLLATGYLFYGPWQRQCEDWGRQKLFEIRDDIFDMAASGRIAFDDPRYQTIRWSVNLLIRFMHECTWPRLIFIAWGLRRERHGRWKRSQMEIAVRRIEDPDLRRDINQKMFHMGHVVFIVMVERSPLLFSLVVVVNAVANLCGFIGAVARISAKVKSKVYRRFFTIAQRDAEFVELQAASAMA